MSEKKSFTWIDDAATSAPLCADGVCTIPDTPQSNPLFTPFTLGKLRLRNRFALAPMGQQRSPGGVPDAAMAAYYVSRAAQGGAGLIFTESTAIDHPSVGEKFPKWPRLHRGPGEAGHAALADAVHAAGSGDLAGANALLPGLGDAVLHSYDAAFRSTLFILSGVCVLTAIVIFALLGRVRAHDEGMAASAGHA